jgi:hypothetical protein
MKNGCQGKIISLPFEGRDKRERFGIQDNV